MLDLSRVENIRALYRELERRRVLRERQGDTGRTSVRLPQLLPHQQPPEQLEGWDVHVLFGGRGAGKSMALSNAAYRHCMGPPCDENVPGGHRGLFIGPTLGDVSEAFESPAGLQAIDPSMKMITRKGGTVISFPNGARLRAVGAYSTEDATRLRSATNTCSVFIEELAACRKIGAAWSNMRLGLRLGPWRKIFAATTPRTKPFVKNLLKDPEVSISSATMFDNPHVPEEFKQKILTLYEGTRLYRQEVLGELIDDVFGALWMSDEIDQSRVATQKLLSTRTEDVFHDLLLQLGEGTKTHHEIDLV